MNIGTCVRMGGIGLMLGGLFLTGCGSGGDSPAQAQSSGVIDLSGVPPNWDKVLPAAQRFVVLAAFNGAAVRDNETGLVWEQSPQTESAKWSSARVLCANKETGNRAGWRLPSVHELASLLDRSVSPGPRLPPGHPFTNVQSARYWSASTDADFPTDAWVVFFDLGLVSFPIKTDSYQVWCVRGGNNADAY